MTKSAPLGSAIAISLALMAIGSASARPFREPPTVSGLTVGEAEARLKAAGFRFNPFGDRSNTYRFVMDVVPSGRRPANWRVCWPRWDRDFEVLDLYAAPTCVLRMPRFTGKHLGDVEKTISSLGLFHNDKNVDPRYVLQADIGKSWVVCEQQPRAGSRVSLRRIQHTVTLKLARSSHCP
jgi:hypothetical protein